MPIDRQDPHRYYLLESEPLAQVLALPTSVTAVLIYDRGLAFSLPRLPSHVRELQLLSCALIGPVVLPEGLEHLRLFLTTSRVPIQEWVFTGLVNSLDIVDCNIGPPRYTDLPVAKLHLSRLKGNPLAVFLPRELVSLTLDRSDFVQLPRLPASLRELRVEQCEKLIDYTEAMPIPIRTLCLMNVGAIPDVYEVFSKVEILVLNQVRHQGPLLELTSTHLRALSIRSTHFTVLIEINAPNLVTLKLVHSNVQLSDSYSDSLQELILEGVRAFPTVRNWGGLESLSVKSSNIELPRIQWLRHLELEQPLLANGVMVRNLDEYKAAWGMTGRKKGMQ